MGSWGVVALADEPGALIAAFVGHHLELGAAEVHVCLDRPNEEARDLLAGVPGAVLHAAGEDGWTFGGTKRRPRSHLGRQKYNASRIFAQTRLDWLLHCDADEFLYPPEEGTIADMLAGAPPEAHWLRVGVAERVWIGGRQGADIFAGAFRLPWERFERFGAEIYDEAALHLLQYGLCGHRMGKCFARRGGARFIGVHHGLTTFSDPKQDPARAEVNGLRILHFDGLTELHYTLKMMRRALAEDASKTSRHTPARQLQFASMRADAAAPAHLHAIHQAAKTVSEAQADWLAAKGLLRRWHPDIPARAERALGRALDLSPAAFDRVLLRREAELVARATEAFGFAPRGLAAK